MPSIRMKSHLFTHAMLTRSDLTFLNCGRGGADFLEVNGGVSVLPHLVTDTSPKQTAPHF